MQSNMPSQETLSTNSPSQDGARRNVVTGPREFFAAQKAAFRATIDARQDLGSCAQALAGQAFDALESNTRRRAAGKPPLACASGCSSCCRGIRVDATAPEVLEVARYIRTLPLAQQEDLAERVTTADNLTRGMEIQERRRHRDPCPLLGKDDRCRVYVSRPLACRGHASYDRQACLDEAAGLRNDIPISLPHEQTRHLVQTALEAALLDSGLEPAQYELNQALRITLADREAEEKWFRGVDLMADALSPISQDSKHGVRAVIARLENHSTQK